MKKVLIATQKPFAREGVDCIKEIFGKKEGYELEILEKYEEEAQFVEAVKDANALIIRSDKVTENIISAAKKLEVIVRAGAGYDNIDLSAASDQGIVAMNTPGQNSNAVAELAIGMMLFNARNGYDGTPGFELRDKKLGIHAYGNVGRFVAHIARGFEMKVYAFDPFVPKDLIERDGVNYVPDVDDIYSICQYVSVHIPFNDNTEQSINYGLLSKMPEGAVLVNTARKEIINEDDLVKLYKERDDFAYLSDIAPDCKDVIESKYKDRCFFTPKKMGAQTTEANVNAGVAAAHQIIGYFEKNDKTFQVNK